MMKILSYLLLGLVLISSGVYATNIEDLINQKVSAIIEKGVQKNIIPSGAYYLHTLEHFEELSREGKTEFRVTAVIKNLNNRTKISFGGLFDENFDFISYLYNYSFFNGAKDLSSNMGFHWLDYASSPDSSYCPPQDFSENSFSANILPAMRKALVDTPLSNVNTSSHFQDLMNYALKAAEGNYPPLSDVWSAPILGVLGSTFLNNYYVITYDFGSITDGDYYWDFVLDVLYQPCSGQKATIYIYGGSNPDDWREYP